MFCAVGLEERRCSIFPASRMSSDLTLVLSLILLPSKLPKGWPLFYAYARREFIDAFVDFYPFSFISIFTPFLWGVFISV